MHLIGELDELQFFEDKNFDIEYLSPVLCYVQWKIENHQWDDYNEFYHAVNFVEKLKRQEGIWFDSHLLKRGNKQIGILFMVGGKIKQMEKRFVIEKEENSLLLKYFHITEKGNGYGSQWLKSCIFPSYKDRQYVHIYLSSSHPASYPFYSRIGNTIGSYEQTSDNQLFVRKGQCFRIDL